MTIPMFSLGNPALDSMSREERVDALIAESNDLIDQALAKYGGGKEIVATVALFSGGNDSTVLTHLMRERVTHAAHINTGIGIEITREFVRQTCADWGLPLLEKHPPPGSSYKELVLAQGFPGPAMHYKMYQRLKERGLMQVRREFVRDPRRQRVLFLAGRRRAESARRAMVPEMERVGSVIWCSPMVNWTALDMNTYRRRHSDCPTNEVSAALHMSGECLCGSFAAKDELSEIGFFFPKVAEGIRELEREVREARPDLPEHRCRWGWGADGSDIDRPYQKELAAAAGPLCSSCEYRQMSFDDEEPDGVLPVAENC